jgi:hypothetical protein
VALKKKRLQFDVSEETLADIDGLKTEVGVRTRASLLREALKVYGTILRKQQDGFDVVFKKDGESQTLLLIL